MNQTEDLQVRVARRYEASPERVFDAWLDPTTAGRWLFATPEGEMVRAEVDARVGGSFTFVDRRNGNDVVHTGEYRELDRPRRLVFTFSVDGSDATTVTVEIVPADGGCELTLSHTIAPEWAEYLARTREGWGTILEGLGRSLA